MALASEKPGVLRKLRKSFAKRFNRLFGLKSVDEARGYVGTTQASGVCQFELMKREGCVPTSRVLEVGCGVLHAGVPLMEYLDPGNYVGMDPNEWLRNLAMEDSRVRQLVASKRARFLSQSDFDASSLGMQFDLVLSHSVLSHAAHRQLEEFIRNVGKVLAPGGRILASLRLAEGNPHGSAGTPDRQDSMHETWQYPGSTWFTFATVASTADAHGLKAVHVPEYTEILTKVRWNEYHDWIVFSHK